MAARRDRWLDQTSLNGIRVVIGSFLSAVALGLPSGFDPHAVFDFIVPADMAETVGTTAWLMLAVMFSLGLMLRVTPLMLVVLVVSSCMATYLFGNADLSVVWQFVAFAASMLLCYGSLRPYEMHNAALFPRLGLRGGAARATQKEVVPRRVKLTKRLTDQGEAQDNLRHMRPVIAPTEQMIGMSERASRRLSAASVQDDEWPEEDIINIFAPH